MLYRGTDGDETGTTGWWTASRAVAEAYGETVREMDPGALRILDLTAVGVGDCDEDGCATDDTLAAVREALATAGVEMPRAAFAELHQLAEARAMQEAARAAGYDAIQVAQWHYEIAEPRPYVATLVIREA